MIDKWLWTIGGMTIDGEDGSTHKKPVPAPFCSSHIPHGILGTYPDWKIAVGKIVAE
jgi:hypothetical protein